MADGSARSRHVQFLNPMPGLALAFSFHGVSYVRQFDLAKSINGLERTERRGEYDTKQLVFVFNILVIT
jgi:hypothetical protein